MLRNNADARRCSYFELGLPVVVLAVHVWGSLMANKRIIFFSDNAAVVDIVNKPDI